MLQDNRRGWASYFGIGGPNDDLYTEEEKRKLRQQSLSGMAQGLLAAGGWSEMPISGAQALGAGFAGHDQARQYAEAGLMERRKMMAEQAKQQQLKDMIAKLPPEQQAMAQAFGLDFFKSEMDQKNKLAIEAEKRKAKDSRTALQKEAEAMFPGDRAKQSAYIQNAREKAGTQVNVGGPGGKVGLMSPEEAAARGLPTNIRWQYDKNGMVEPVQGTLPKDAPESAGGMNPRQAAGRAARNSAALDYVTNLTGVPKDELAKMSPDQVAQVMREKGGRGVQGVAARVVSGIPFVGQGITDAINSDIAPFSSQMAAGQVSINNPAGDVGEKAFELARRQVPSPEIPLEQQAQMIQKMLEENQQQTEQPTRPKRKRFNPQTGQLEDV